MANPTIRSSTTNQSSATDTSPIGLRASGVSVGDALYACVFINATSVTVTAVPSGWTLLDTIALSSARMAVYWKMVTGSEPASYGWTVSTAAGWIVQIVCVQNPGDTTTPTDVSAIQTNASSSNVPAPSVTTTRPNGLMIGFFGMRQNATFTPDPAMTEIQDAAWLGPPTTSLETAWQIIPTIGATGTRTAVASNVAVSISWLGVVLGPAGAPAVQPYYAASITNTGTSAAPTCNLPAGAAAGELIYVCLMASSSGTIPAITSAPPGYTLLDTTTISPNTQMAVYWAFAPNLTALAWAFAASVSWVVQAVLVRTPGDLVTPTDDHAIQQNAASNNVVAPAITTTRAYDLLIGFFGTHSVVTFIADARMAEVQDQSAAANCSLETAWEAFTGGIGSTLTRTATVTASPVNIGWLGAVKGPAAVVAGGPNVEPFFWSL